jgi:hypothetical protein
MAPILRGYPRSVTHEEFLEIARRFEGQTLETVTGKRFKVGISHEGPFYTPESSGYGQSDGKAAAIKFVEAYTRTGSLRPGEYAKVSRNSSYHVAVLIAAGASRTSAPRPGAGHPGEGIDR